jgi:hypothetical protein
MDTMVGTSSLPFGTTITVRDRSRATGLVEDELEPHDAARTATAPMSMMWSISLFGSVEEKVK